MTGLVEQQLAADIMSTTERQMLGAVALAEALAARGWVNLGYAAAARDAEWAELTMHLSGLTEKCFGCSKKIDHAELCCVHVKLRTGERLFECAPCAGRNGRRGFAVPDVDAEPSAS